MEQQAPQYAEHSGSLRLGLLCCFFCEVSEVVKKKNWLSSSKTQCSVIKQWKPESQFVLRAQEQGRSTLSFHHLPPPLSLPTAPSVRLHPLPWPPCLFLALSRCFYPLVKLAQGSINFPSRVFVSVKACFSLPLQFLAASLRSPSPSPRWTTWSSWSGRSPWSPMGWSPSTRWVTSQKTTHKERRGCFHITR